MERAPFMTGDEIAEADGGECFPRPMGGNKGPTDGVGWDRGRGGAPSLLPPSLLLSLVVRSAVLLRSGRSGTLLSRTAFSLLETTRAE